MGGDGNGSFTSSLALQTTTNGTTWVTSAWTVSPTYSYTNTTAGITYTFTGAPVLVRGVRVVGLVNTSASSSKRARVREVLAYGGQNVASLTAPTTALAEERAPGNASKVLARPEQQGGGAVCASFGIAVSGCEARSYYSFGGQRVAMRVQRDEQPTGSVTWLHSDHLGSASLATDAAGLVIAQSRYKPYGEERVIAGTLPTDRKFTGYARESGIGGIDFAQARFYSPKLGRFLSADSIVPMPSNPQTLNRYAYGFNSPLVYNDPTGHCPLCVGGILLLLLLTGCSVDQTPAPAPNIGVTIYPQSTSTSSPTSTPTQAPTSAPTQAPTVAPATATPSTATALATGDNNPFGLISPIDDIEYNNGYGEFLSPDGSTYFHDGYDVRSQSGNTQVRAMASGEVAWVDSKNAAVGIKSENGIEIQYTHLDSTQNATLSKGQKIKQGEIIGNYGPYGDSNYNHLHVTFRIGPNRRKVNPDSYWPGGRPTGWTFGSLSGLPTTTPNPSSSSP